MKTKEEAMGLARTYSRWAGGSGKVELDASKHGWEFPHAHALDANGERLPGHIWYGKAGAVGMLLDFNSDGVLNGADLLQLLAPLGVEIVTDSSPCSSNPDCI